MGKPQSTPGGGSKDIPLSPVELAIAFGSNDMPPNGFSAFDDFFSLIFIFNFLRFSETMDNGDLKQSLT